MIQLRPNTPDDGDELVEIWRRSVDASHHFLTPEDRSAIDPLAEEYIRTAQLIVAVRDGKMVAFMGVTGQAIDSLFVDPAAQGVGVGRLLTNTVGRPVTVEVNEQNGAGVAFYRHLGFEVIGRSESDGEGRPYPLLHMRRD